MQLSLFDENNLKDLGFKALKHMKKKMRKS